MTPPLRLSDGLIARIVASAHMVGNEFVVVPYCIYPELAVAFARHVKYVWCLCPSKEDAEWLQSPATPKNVEVVHADVMLADEDEFKNEFGQYDIVVITVPDNQPSHELGERLIDFTRATGTYLAVQGDEFLGAFSAAAHKTENEIARDMLQKAIVALYGIEGIPAMAKDFAVTEKTVADWVSGRNERFTMYHGIWKSIYTALHDKARAARAVSVQINDLAGSQYVGRADQSDLLRKNGL